jgi:hypothetical protein
MIGRRGFLVSAAAFGVTRAVVAQPVPPSERLAFRLVREGNAIGTHVVSFDRLDNGLDVHIAVDIAVRFGPLVLFRYTLRGLEQWRNGSVVHLDATTNDNGTPDQVRADRDTRGLWVEGSQAPRYLAPSDALPATHWNMARLRRRPNTRCPAMPGSTFGTTRPANGRGCASRQKMAPKSATN